MRESMQRRIEEADRVGSRIVARFWGSFLLLAVLLAALPVFIASIWQGSWTGAIISGLFGTGALLWVRYLFSRDRRLGHFE